MRASFAKGKEVVEVVSYATEDVTVGDAPIMKVKEEDPAVMVYAVPCPRKMHAPLQSRTVH